MPKSELLPSLFAQLLFFKEQWDASSCCSLQKSDLEWIAPVALYKRATVSESLLFIALYKIAIMSDSLFLTSELLFHSYPHKKRVLPSKNQEQIPNLGSNHEK